MADHALLQACLRGEVKARAFMSAPLLAELAAIEQMMLDKAGKRAAGHEPTTPEATSSPVQAGEEQGSAADQSHASSSVPECSAIDEDCVCAICLVRGLFRLLSCRLRFPPCS